MRKITLLALVVVAAMGCKDKKQEAGKEPATPVIADPTVPRPKAAYTPDAAKAQIAALASCSTEYNCAAFDTLVGFGVTAKAELMAAAADLKAPVEKRELVAKVITKIKIPDVGVQLVELGNGIPDTLKQEAFYEAAGASGGDATFDVLIKEFEKANASTDDNRDIPLRHGLKAFPAKSMAWAKSALPKSKDAVGVVDVVTDVATEADRDTIAAMIPETKNPMAKGRLAGKALLLGSTDPKLFDVLIAELSSDDDYDRADAGTQIASVVDKVPADKKAKILELVKKALEKHPGDAMVNGGLFDTQKKLGGG